MPLEPSQPATTTPSPAPGDGDVEDVVPRGLLATLHDHAVRLLRSSDRGAVLAADAVARHRVVRGSATPDERGELVALARILHELAMPELSARGRPRHVDDPAARAELGRVDRPRGPDGAVDEALVAAGPVAWEAATTLEPTAFAILDLHVRHGLSSQELAEVLRVDASDAHVLLGRVREEAEHAIAAHLALRACTRRCDGLDDAVLAEPAPSTPWELHERVAGHVAHCATCAPVVAGLPPALDAYARLATLPVPADLPALVAERRAAVPTARTTPSGAGGRRRLAAAALLALAAVAVGAALAGGLPSDGPTGGDLPADGLGAPATGVPAPSRAPTAGPGGGPPDATAPVVAVSEPGDGARRPTRGTDGVGPYAVVDLAAVGDDDRDRRLSWRWASDAQQGTLLNEARGSTRLYAEGCGATAHRLTASAVDDAGNRGHDVVEVVVEHAC